MRNSTRRGKKEEKRRQRHGFQTGDYVGLDSMSINRRITPEKAEEKAYKGRGGEKGGGGGANLHFSHS